MRRFAAAVIAIGSVLALAACSLPSGVDGNLVNNWTTLPVPQQVTPQAGECHSTVDSDLIDNAMLSCDDSHLSETVYVGTFTGTDGKRLSPPPVGSTSQQKAYASCVAPAAKFLGAQWYDGAVTLDLVVPDPAGWTGGARWYMCDVSETSMVDDYTAALTTGSLKGALAAGKPLRLTCIDWVGDTSVSNFSQGTCTKSHSGEFVGAFQAANIPYPTDTKLDTLADDGCESLVAKFLGFHGIDDYFNETVGWVSDPPTKDRWNSGDREIRCYAASFTKDGHFIGSVKGIRGAKAKG